MKRMKFANLLIIGLTLTLAGFGCKKNPYGVTPLPGSKPGMVGEADGGNAIKPGDGTEGAPGSKEIAATPAGSHAGWPEDAEALKAQSIHFDYDSSVIKSNEKSKLAAVADYLKGHPAAAVRVEGNCDERGTEEYNRALGERRALAAREQLVTLGIDPSRVDTISYGKDRRIDLGESESAHAKNRRDDFVVLTPP
jgi:peptidoglycan-associated lipoprotein